MLFQTMAPAPNIHDTPPNSFMARVNAAQPFPALYPSYHFRKNLAHQSESASHSSDFQYGKNASLEHQSISQYSGPNLERSVSYDYLPYSPAEFGGGEDSNAHQETKLNIKNQPLELAMSDIPKYTTPNAQFSSMKRSSDHGDILPSAKRLATSSHTGYLSIPRQSQSTKVTSPVISTPLSSAEEIARRPIAQACRPSLARRNGRAAPPQHPIKVEPDTTLYPPPHSARLSNHAQQYYEATPPPPIAMLPPVDTSPRQMARASFPSTPGHPQRPATSAHARRRHEAPPLIKNEQGSPALPRHAAAPETITRVDPTPLAGGVVSLDDELDRMHRTMRRLSRKVTSLRNELSVLQTQAAESAGVIEGLRSEVTRLSHEVVKLERDALRREVAELRRRVV